MIAPKYNIRSPSTNLSAHEIKHHNMWKHFVDTLTDSVKIIFLQVLVVFNCFVYIFAWCFFSISTCLVLRCFPFGDNKRFMYK